MGGQVREGERGGKEEKEQYQSLDGRNKQTRIGKQLWGIKRKRLWLHYQHQRWVLDDVLSGDLASSAAISIEFTYFLLACLHSP